MAPPWLPTAEGPPKPSQHPDLALRQRGEASTGTQQLDVMDDLQQEPRNTQVTPESGQGNHTSVTRVPDPTPSHTDTSRDGSISPTKQNTMTQTQAHNQAQAPMIQNDGNSHSSCAKTEFGPLSGPPASSDRGLTIANPETRLISPSSTEDEVREAIDAILNEDSTKARIQDLTEHYIKECLKGNRSAVVGSLREEVRRQIRAAALRGLANLEDGSSSLPNLNPQEQAAYQQLMRQHLIQKMKQQQQQQQARSPSAQQGSSPNLASVRPESRSASTPQQNAQPGQHGTTDNRLSQATDAQPPTLPRSSTPSTITRRGVSHTTSTEMMHPRTSDAADAGLMSGHHGQNSQKRPGDCVQRLDQQDPPFLRRVVESRSDAISNGRE